MNELINLPAGWLWTSLREIAEKINPGFPSGKHNQESRGIPHLRPMNINAKGEIDFSVVKYVQPDFYDPLLKGDVLFNNTNSPELLGKTAYIKDDTNWAYSNHMTRIRLNSSFLNYAWISYYLHSLFLKGFFKMRCTHHVNQASINSTFLSQNVPIPLPPLPEQRRIVTKLEELFTRLDAGVSELKKTQAQLKRYRQSVLKAACEGKIVPTEAELAKTEGGTYEPADVLLARILKERSEKEGKGAVALDISRLPELPEGWCWTKFEQIVSLSQNGFGKRSSKEGNPTIVLRLADIINGEISLNNVRRIGATNVEIEKYKLLNNDILCIRVNGSRNLVGRMIRYKPAIEPITFCDHFIRFQLSEPTITHFLSMYFDTERVRKFIEFNMVSSAGQNTVSQSTMMAIPIPLPPLAEQRRIVAEVERRLSIAEEVEKTVGQSLTQAQRLRQSIFKKAFEGRLVTQDVSDEPADLLLERIKVEKMRTGNGTKKSKQIKRSIKDVT